MANPKFLQKKSIMKKIIFLLTLLPFTGFCQDNYIDYNKIINEIKLLKGDNDKEKKEKVHRLEVGLNGGVNIANLIDVDLNSGLDISEIAGNKLGALYGGTLIYNFNRFLCLKGDFDIASKGFEVKNLTIPNDLPNLDSINITNGKQLLNYFDIPAFFHLGFGKKLKFDLNFGPYISFLLENRSKLYDSENNVINQGAVIEFGKDGLSKIDWGITYGAGIDYHLTEKISIGFDFLIEQGQKVLNGGDLLGEFKNYSQDFDFGVNFLLIEKKSKKLF